jgi:two-component system, OmpR family, response regulator
VVSELGSPPPACLAASNLILGGSAFPKICIQLQSQSRQGKPIGETGRQSLHLVENPVRVLLLDDDPENLLLRAAILRKHGYLADTAGTIGEAEKLLNQIDIAVLDYHLGAGQFGTEVASILRRRRPEVPIIILSSTLERRFGGVEDMHLLKGYSSVDDLIAALRSFEAKHRGRPVVVDARDFFYSRIGMAIGEDVVLEILNRDGEWMYVNESCARLLERPRDWFPGKNMFAEMPDLAADWREILRTVAEKRETYIDRTYRGLLNLPRKGEEWVWNVLAFPLTLHNDETGVVLTARILERKTLL